MTDEHLGLLAAIRTNPADDLVRLVYADWVEENGDPDRATLIRCHIERERAEPNSATQFDLATRAGFLLAENRDRWTADLHERFGVTAVEFDRGIPAVAELPERELVTRGAELFAAFPVRHIRLTGVQEVTSAYKLPLPADVRRSLCVVRRYPWEIDDWHDGRYEVELLSQAPPELESQLTVGRWLVQCYGVWSEPDRQTLQQWYESFLHDPRDVTECRQVQLAVRPVDREEGFESWCSTNVPFSGLRQVSLQDGEELIELEYQDPLDWYAQD